MRINKTLPFLIITLTYIISSCSKNKEKMITILEGNISNLPDGMMYRSDRLARVQDSSITKDGKFAFKVQASKFAGPSYAQLKHRSAKDSVIRLFVFPTKQKIREKPVYTSLIMLESPASKLSGNLMESNVTKSLKSVSIKGNLTLGKQSLVLYSDTLNSTRGFRINAFGKQIEEHPYSYHLFFKLVDVSHSLTSAQISRLLSKFDRNIRDSEQAKSLIK